jgi:phosphonate transport system permease protein
MSQVQQERLPLKKAPVPREGFWSNWGWILGFSVLLVLGSLLYTLNMSWDALTSGDILQNLLQILGEMFPPDLSVILTLGKPIVETLAMSVMSTLLAVAIAFPLSFLAPFPN